MKAIRNLGRSRRSGISNLIGAIFFILIVALSVSILTVMFTGSSGYIQGIHTTNQQEVQSANSAVAVTNATFGGEMEGSGLVIPVNSTGCSAPCVGETVPIRPITNMNLSGSLKGWFVSTSYQPELVDTASVTNADNITVSNPQGSRYYDPNGTLNYQKQSNDGAVFALTVTNTTPNAHNIAKVSLLVDTYFNQTNTGLLVTGQPTPAGWSFVVTGNNITWTTPGNLGFAITPHSSLTFYWFADVSPTVSTYYHTVVLYWVNGLTKPYVDDGIATVQTLVAIPLPGFGLLPVPVTLTPPDPAQTPGGMIAGYDSDALGCTSSGPGCLYVTFKPSLDGQTVPAAEQLSATASFTTTFSLTANEVAQLALKSNASMWSNLDEAASVPNSLSYFHLTLVNPAGTQDILNPGGTDLATVNHFSTSGWHEQLLWVDPAAGFWVAGAYKLELVVNMTMPGGQPSELQMHFDDIGLALNLISPVGAGSAYANSTLAISYTSLTGVGANEQVYDQVQQIYLTTNMTMNSVPGLSLPDTLAYVYVESVPVGIFAESVSATWVEVGSVNFTGSATLNVLIPQPAAASMFLESSVPSPHAVLTIKVVAISVGSGSACAGVAPASVCTLTVDSHGIVQVANTVQAVGQAVIGVDHPQGTSPVHLVAMYISGVNAAASSGAGVGNGVVQLPLNDWLGVGGSTFFNFDFGAAPTTFEWVPGQVYLVSVVSSSGTVYSSSFTAPS